MTGRKIGPERSSGKGANKISLVPLWCWRYRSGHVGAALWQRGREPSRQTGETRQPVEIRCGRGSHSSWMATPRCRTAVARYASMVDLRAGDAPAWARMRHAARSTGGGGESTGCAKRPIAGVVDIAYGRRRPRETSGTFAGHEGTEKASCIEAETVVAREVVAVAREASPAVRSTDTVTATPSASNKRPAAHVEFDTPRSPQATAGQLHRGASRSNAGPNRLRRKTADRPAKLNDPRRPGAADAAPGAADLSRSTSATDAQAGLPVRRGSWPFPYRIDTHAVVDALGGRPGPTPAAAVRRGPPGRARSCFGFGSSRRLTHASAANDTLNPRAGENRRRRSAARVRAGLRDGPVPADADWLHNIADETHVVAPVRFEAFAARRDLAAATVRNRGGGGANPVAAEPVRRRTRPSRSTGPGAARTGRCAGRRPRHGRG